MVGSDHIRQKYFLLAGNKKPAANSGFFVGCGGKI